jgi:hypothetical protein
VRTARSRHSVRVLLLTAVLISSAAAPASVSAADNLPPVAVDDPAVECGYTGFGGSFPIPEDWGQFVFAGCIGELTNDFDPDGSIVAWQIDSPPAHGTLDWLASNPTAFAYTPAPDFSTPSGDWPSDSFTYHVIDNQGASSDIATYRFWIAPINDPPRFLAVPHVEVPMNSGPYSESWLPYVVPGPPNESSQTVHFIITHAEAYAASGGNLLTGPVTFTDDGRLTFTPAPDQYGDALITVYLKDDGGLEHYTGVSGHSQPDDTSDPVTFRIDVVRPNTPPVAVDDIVTLDEDAGPVVIPVWANDTDPEGDLLFVTAATNGTKGVVTLEHGLTYHPNLNASGSDFFTYTVTDRFGASATATVHVTINPVDDPPAAVDDNLTVDEDSGATSIAVTANDSDVEGDQFVVSGVGSATKGSVSMGSDQASAIYTPGANATGTDTFTYTVTDSGGASATATVHVTIRGFNDPPVAVNDAATFEEDTGAHTIAITANDSDVDGDSLTVTSVSQPAFGTAAISADRRSVTYASGRDANGSDSFNYTIADGRGGSASATVYVTIAAINDAPAGVADFATFPEDSEAQTIDLVGNDSDVEGDALSILLVDGATKGYVTLLGDRHSIAYFPIPNAYGTDLFHYTVVDGHGGVTTVAVEVTLTPLNDPPSAFDDGYWVPIPIGKGAGPVPIYLLANDSSAPDEPEPLTITSVAQGSHGIVAISADRHSVTYDPIGLVAGPDQFLYSITDGNGGVASAMVYVNVDKDPTPPVVSTPVVGPERPLEGSKVRLAVTWTADDPESGVKSSQLQFRRDGGDWSDVKLSALTDRQASVLVAPGHSYQFRVRATNGASPGATSGYSLSGIVAA